MIRVLYDARKITPQVTGVGYVVKKLLAELLGYKELEIIAFTKKGVNNIFDSPRANLVIQETNDNSEYFGLKRVLFEQIEIPNLIKKYKANILHLTNGFGVPVFLDKKNLKIVLTIHDLIPLTPYKELMSPLNNLIFKTLFTYGVKNADEIVTVSQFTANDVKKYFPQVKSVHVVYNGIDSQRKIKKNDDLWDKIKKKYKINQEYILYIGGFAPRKNVLKLLEAFRLLVQDKKYQFQLLLCGKFTKNRDVQSQLNKINQFIIENDLKNRVILVGYLNLEEKEALLMRAKFFVYLSIYEGFGLPILEALSQNTPVLTSKDSVMQEIAENYASYSDPQNPKDIQSHMNELITNYSSYKKLAESANIELVPKFNWKIVGQKYFNIYSNLI